MSSTPTPSSAAEDFRARIGSQTFATLLADPPWQFQNRTGKVAPEHRRLSRYSTMTLDDIKALPVADAMQDRAHLYLWVPNALLPEGLAVMMAWGFQYKSNLVWHKIRKDGGPDGRGVGFYFRNTTELVLFGTRGKNVRTLAPGRRQVNILKTQKREHSRKPDEFYDINTWDTDARPESTRSRWRLGIHKSLESIQEAAVVHVTEILEREKLIDDVA